MKKLICTICILTMLFISVASAATTETYVHDGIKYGYTINSDGTATIISMTPNPGNWSNFKNYDLVIPSEVNGITVTALGRDPDEKCIMGDNSYCPNSEAHSLHIKSITIPNTVHTIGERTFCGIADYITFIIPDSVVSFGDVAFMLNVFSDCKSVNISDQDIQWANIEYIGGSAFCSAEFTSIHDLDSLKHLGSNAFENCTDLKSIRLPNTLEYIGFNPFYGCTNLSVIEVDNDNHLVAFNNGVLFEKPTKRLVTYLPALTAKEYAIPDGILIIGRDAFYKCNNLETIILPESVTTIESGAFRYCENLKSVTISGSVTTIGGGAFAYCGKLESVIISDSVTSIGDGAFIPCPKLKSVEIPSSVTEIGSAAFNPMSCVLIVEPDSYAHEYAIENGYAYQLKGGNSDMDWLD